MAIDLVSEHIISLREAAGVLPRRNGKAINFSTLWRWSYRGLRGVRLETLRIGGTLYTSHEALQRFAIALTAGEPVGGRTTKQQQQATDRANREAKAAGF